MRLKKLILHGFKSFADRTELVFDCPITGIVGPNGCGKSNVVDGFKWVLGEQSAKSLRGEAMLDVIFNGSASRKPSGMAEVVLVFDNPNREDGTRLLNIDTDEVSVGRRLYRDGTSEYQVNNQATRLKDIRELFFDTGVGVDAYSVIEQGKVDLLLQSNPQERRLIFEEAAGISKYKAKKKEAQRKLERVDQNLLRLHDIVEEVEKRLRSVKVQAGRARTFQEHTLRLNELRLSYALQEYYTHHEQLGKLNAQREDAQFRLDDITADLGKSSSELATKREQFDTLSRKRQSADYELVQVRAAMQSSQQKQQYATQQLEQIAEQLAACKQDRTALEEKLAGVTASLEADTQTLGRLTTELEEKRGQIDQRQQAFRDGQLQLNQCNSQIEQHKVAILDLMRRLAQVNSRLGAIEIERKNIAGHQARLAERRRVVLEEREKLETQRGEHQQKLDAVVATIADQQAQLEAWRNEALSLGKQVAQVSEQLGAAKEHRSGLVSRERLLRDLEARREGVSEGVKSVLRQREERFSFIRGLVADVLRVDVEHAHAIEAALDGRDQMLVTHDSTSAVAAEEQLADLEGRVNVLCTDRLPVFEDGYNWNQHPQRIRLAADLVRFEPADAPIALHLLGRTVVTESLADASELHRTGPRGYRFVTGSGEVIETDGTLRAGPLTAAMGLISRRSELEALIQQIEDVDRRIVTLGREVSEGSAQVKSLEEQCSTLRNAIYQSNTTKVELTSQIAQVNDKLGSLNREQPLLERELQSLYEQTGRLAAEQLKLNEQRQAMEAEQSSRQQQVEELSRQQQQVAEDLRQCNEQLTATRVELGQVQEKQLACQQHVQRQAAAKTELGQQIERVAKTAETVAGRRQSVQEELELAQRAEMIHQEQLKGLAQQVEQLAGEVDELGKVVEALNVRVEEVRTLHAQIEQTLHQLQLQSGELSVRLETLVERTQEELQLDLPAKYAEGYQPGEVSWDEVAEEIKVLRDKIHRLGNVNLDAINELDELEKRQQFLSTQYADLANSKQQLEELIDTINKESSVRFEQTFNAVREHFQGMFRKLFGGGKADIFLETELAEPAAAPVGPDGQPLLGPDGQPLPAAPARKYDILEAGIEIIAKPPGKQPCSISQLSGGEKTMTCVALLMSIFKSKPSPFCLLDEVDAALDEANNQRFNLIVQEFLEQSQFIIITHSKRTMQIADMLYGVTMQEQGVSKRVAVKFDQVGVEGQISEHAAA